MPLSRQFLDRGSKRADRRQVVDEGRAKTPRDVIKRQPPFQAQIVFVLRAGAVIETDKDVVCIINRFRPDEASEERQRMLEALFRFELQGLIGRIADVLPLKYGAQIGESAQRLQVARPGIQIFPRFCMQRSVEPAKDSQVCALTSDIGRFQENLAGQVTLKAGVPLLNIRVWARVDLNQNSWGSRRRTNFGSHP